jgi:hypothetical protein
MPRPARRGTDAQWESAIYGDSDDRRGGRQRKKRDRDRNRGDEARQRRGRESLRHDDDWLDDDWEVD